MKSFKRDRFLGNKSVIDYELLIVIHLKTIPLMTSTDRKLQPLLRYNTFAVSERKDSGTIPLVIISKTSPQALKKKKDQIFIARTVFRQSL